MDFTLLANNITNPTLLFFLLGIVATIVRSDLEIPAASSKFISLYLLFAIGFKGGQELRHGEFTTSLMATLGICMLLSVLIPVYTFFLLRRRHTAENAAAIAATYGSVSAVTFVSATLFLDTMGVTYGGHMVAAMALMEAPAIMVGVMLMRWFGDATHPGGLRKIVHESLTNGSVLMITGSLLTGLIANDKGAEGIRPFTTDIFKGFLSIFLLDMGMTAARRVASFRKHGLSMTLFAVLVPLANGILSILLTHSLHIGAGNRLLVAILAAGASYIAVPAAMKQAAPNADPGLYIPMALGITFPLNITIGLPLYWTLIQHF